MNPEYAAMSAEAGKQSRLDAVVQSFGRTGYEGWSEQALEEAVARVPHLKGKAQQELEAQRDKLLPLAQKSEKANRQLQSYQQALELSKRRSGGQVFKQNTHAQQQQQQQHHMQQQGQPQGTMKQSDRMKASMPQGKAAAGRPAGLGSTQQQIDRGNILRPSLNLHSGGRIVMGRPGSADAAAAHPPRREQPQTAGRAAAAAGSGRAKDRQELGGILGSGPAGQAAKQDKVVAFFEGFPVNASVEKAKCAKCHRSMMRNLLQHVDEKGELRCQGCWLKLNDTCSTAWPGEVRGQAPVQQMLAQARGLSQAKAPATRIGPAVRAASLRVQDGKVHTAMGVAKSVAAVAVNAVNGILGFGRKPTGQAAAAAAAGGAAGTRKRSGGARDGPIELGDTDDEEDEEGGAAAAGAPAAAGPALRRSGRTTTPTNPSQRYAGFKALYPPGGGRSAVQVLAEDLDRLEEMEFLNDTIIDYYMRVLEEELRDQAGGERFYFFNSFFYKKLSEKTGARAGTQEHNALAYERVKKWTKGVDIFAKDFLFIPIHDALHWSLIIVCHPGQLARSSRAGTPQPAAAAPGARRKAGGAAAAASSPGQRKRTRGQEQQAPMTPPKEPSPADLLQSSSSSSEADVEVAEVGPGSDEAEEVVQVQPAPAAAGRSGASGRGRGGSKAEALDMFTVPTACILHLDSMSDGHTTIPLCRDIRAYLEQEFLHKQAKSAEAEGEAEEDGNGGSRPQQQQQQQSGEQQASLPQQWSQDHQGQQLKVTDKNLPHRKLHELPRQDNHCDCGLFVLTYTEYFTYAMLQREYSINVGHLQKNGHWAVKPQEAAAMDLPFPHFMRKRWFAPVIASHLRAFLQYRIFDLMLQQAPAELQDTEAYRDMQKQKQELEQLMNSQMGYTTRYLRPLDWAHNAEDIYAQMDKEEQERAERNRNQRAARAAARQQQQAPQPEELRTRCGAAAEKRAAAKKASRNLAQIAAEVGPDTEDAISSSSGGEGQEAPTRRRKKRRSQQLDTTDDEWRQSQQQQEEASQGSPVKRQRGSEAGFHMSAADFSDSSDEEEAIDVSTDTPDEPSPEAEPQEEAKRQAVLQDLYEHVGQAEAQALLQGHPLSPKREKGLRQVLSRHMELGVYGGLDSSTLVDALRNLVGDVPLRPGARQKDGRKRQQQLEGGGGRHAAAAKRRKGSKQGQGTPAGPGPGQLSMHDFTRKQQQEEQQEEPACPYAEQQGQGSGDLEQEDSMRILESASSGTSDEADNGQGPVSSTPAAAQQLYGSQGSQQQPPNGLTSPGVQLQVTHRTSQAAPQAELEMSLYDRVAEDSRRSKAERMRAAAAAAMAAGAPAPLGPPPPPPAGAAGAAVDRAAALARAEVRATPAVDLVSEDGLSDSADEAAAGNSTGVGAFASGFQQYQVDRQDIFAGLPPPAAVAAAAGGAGQHQQHRNGLPHPLQPRIGNGGRRRQVTPQAAPAAAGNPFTGYSCGDASGNPQQQGQQQQAPKQHVRRQKQQQQQVVEGQTAGAAAGPVPDPQHHNADQRRQERQAAQFGTHQGRSRKQPHVQPLLSPPKGSPQAPRGGPRGQQAGYNPDGKQLFDEVREEVGAMLKSAAGPSQGDDEDWVQLGDSDDDDGDPERLPQQQPAPPQPQQQQRQPRQQQQQSAPAREWLQQGHPRPQQGGMPPANSAQALQLQQDEAPADAQEWARQQALADLRRDRQQAQQQQAQVVPQLARRNPQWHPQRPAPTHAPSVGGGFNVPQAAPPGAVQAIAQQLLAHRVAHTGWLTQAGSHPPPPQQQQHMQPPPAQRQQWRQSQTSNSVGEELVDLCND